MFLMKESLHSAQHSEQARGMWLLLPEKFLRPDKPLH